MPQLMPQAPFRLTAPGVEPHPEPARAPPIPAASKVEAVTAVLERPILQGLAVLTARSNHLSPQAAVAAMEVAAAMLRMAARAAEHSGSPSPAHWPSPAEVRQTAKMETPTVAAGRAAAFGLPPGPLPDQELFPQTAAPATGLAVGAAADAFPWDTRPVSLPDLSRLMAAADTRRAAPERFTQKPTASPWGNCWWTTAVRSAPTHRCLQFMARLLHLLTLRSVVAR